MNIKGLDYNTEREKLVMPEYGREIQMMVDYCKALDNRRERQVCAETIVKTMKVMHPQATNTANLEQKLWNHLAIMSNFELDIDYPFEVTRKEEFLKRPQPLKYPMQQINKRHYGYLMESLFEKLKEMPEGADREELIRLTANQMKRSLFVWNRGTADEEKIASDLAQFTDGRVQLDLDEFRFEKIDSRDGEPIRNKKKKR